MAMMHGGNIFSVARSRGWNWREVLDFSASINPLGPAPGVHEAICSATDRIVHYPDRDGDPLRAALANAWGLQPEQIVAGNGATELIFFLARMLHKVPVTLALPVFSEFQRAFPHAGVCDLQDSANWPDTGLLVLTRPANPTGWTLPLEPLATWLREAGGIALVDESFIDFAAARSALDLLEEFSNLIVLRSLTKFYALPGLRVGALAASRAPVERWMTSREPWQVNVLAEQAAITALAATEHAERSRAFVASEREWLAREIAALPGASPRASDANFIYVDLSHGARTLCEALLERKIMIRDCTHWPGLEREAVRIAMRRREENQKLIAAWKEWAGC